MKKRILATIVAIVMVVTMMPQAAFAENNRCENQEIKIEETESKDSQGIKSSVIVQVDDVLSLGGLLADNKGKLSAKAHYKNRQLDSIISSEEQEAIVKRVSNLDNVRRDEGGEYIAVNVKGYGITTDNVLYVYQDILNSSPELFYFDRYEAYYYGNKIDTIQFYLNDSASKIKQKKRIIDSKVKKIDLLIEPGMSEMDKVLFVHDYLVANTEYDKDGYESGKYSRDIFNLYGVFGNNLAVCQGYAHAASYLLNRFGVTCGVASSDKANHAWNVVKINGKWYHMDVTWDDPTYDKLGQVTHDYVLLSEKGLLSMEDCAMRKDFLISCASKYSMATDNSLANNFWKKSEAMMHYYNDNWYYMEHNNFTLKEYSKKTKQHRVIVDNSNFEKKVQWEDTLNPGYIWNDNFSKLAAKKNVLYFSLPREIYALNLNNLERGPYRICDFSYIPQQIYGIAIYDDQLILSVKDSPDENINEWANGKIYDSEVSTACRTRISAVKTDYNQIKVNYVPIKMFDDNGNPLKIHYRVQYKQKNQQNYKFIDTTNTSLTIKKLKRNYRYDICVYPYYLNEDGRTTFGRVSSSKLAVTNPLNRYVPAGNFKVFYNSPTKVIINTNIPVVNGGKTKCQLAYKPATNKKFKYKYFTGKKYVLSGLRKNVKYNFKLRYIHTDNKTRKKIYSTYSPVSNFTIKK